MHALYKNYICNWLCKIRFFFVVPSTKLVLQSARIEWPVSAGSLIQQTSKEMAVWLLV